MIVKGYDIDLDRATFSLSQRGVLNVGPWLVRGIRPAIAAARGAAMPHEVVTSGVRGPVTLMTAGSPVEITAQDDGRGHRLTGTWPLVAVVGADGRATFVGRGGGIGQTTIPSASPETISKVGGVVVVLGAIAVFWMMGKAATAEKNPRRRVRRNGGPWERGKETVPFDALVLPGKTRDWAKKHWETYGFDYDASAGEVIVWPLSSMRQLRASLEARGVPFHTRQATWRA